MKKFDFKFEFVYFHSIDLLKCGFRKKSSKHYECNETLASATANPPKSDEKYAQKSVQQVSGSSFRSDFLQNPYFKLPDMDLAGSVQKLNPHFLMSKRGTTGL